MSFDSDTTGAAMAEEIFHFRGPLRMGCTAESKSMSKQTGPIFTGAQIGPFGEAEAPEILGALFAMPIMRVAPRPGSQRFVLIGLGIEAGGAAILPTLRGK